MVKTCFKPAKESDSEMIRAQFQARRTVTPFGDNAPLDASDTDGIQNLCRILVLSNMGIFTVPHEPCREPLCWFELMVQYQKHVGSPDCHRQLAALLITSDLYGRGKFKRDKAIKSNPKYLNLIAKATRLSSLGDSLGNRIFFF